MLLPVPVLILAHLDIGPSFSITESTLPAKSSPETLHMTDPAKKVQPSEKVGSL